jgi:hypothetical protein
MILTSTPDPDQVRSELRDVTDVVWMALEVGISRAREYFDELGVENDPHLAAHITRYHAKLFLEEHQQHAEYERRELSNSGLSLLVQRAERCYDLRVRKSDDGELPVPQSAAMQSFYYQPVLIGFEGDVPPVETIKLLILWEAPKTYTHIAGVTLACPSVGGSYRGEVEAHWRINVPHPATTTVFAPTEVESEVPEEPITELAIEALPDEMTGTGSDGDEG